LKTGREKALTQLGWEIIESRVVGGGGEDLAKVRKKSARTHGKKKDRGPLPAKGPKSGSELGG